MDAAMQVVEVSMAEVEARAEGWTAEVEVVPVALSPEARQVARKASEWVRTWHVKGFDVTRIGALLRVVGLSLGLSREDRNRTAKNIRRTLTGRRHGGLRDWYEDKTPREVARELEALAGVDL